MYFSSTISYALLLYACLLIAHVEVLTCEVLYLPFKQIKILFFALFEPVMISSPGNCKETYINIYYNIYILK